MTSRIRPGYTRHQLATFMSLALTTPDHQTAGQDSQPAPAPDTHEQTHTTTEDR